MPTPTDERKKKRGARPSPPPTPGTGNSGITTAGQQRSGSMQGKSEADVPWGEIGSTIKSGLETASDYARFTNPASAIGGMTRDAARSVGRIADYTAEGVSEAETPAMKVGAAIGRPIAGAFNEAVSGMGEGIDRAYTTGNQLLRGMGGATSADVASGAERNQDEGQRGSEDGQRGRSSPDTVGIQQRGEGDSAYYVNRDVDPERYGQAIYAGDKAGATTQGFERDMAQEGAAPSSRFPNGPSAPPIGNESLALANQAMEQGNYAAADQILNGPERAEGTQNEIAKLRRQATTTPSLNMPFDQFFQTAAQRNQAQEQLATLAEKQAAQTKAAQSNRDSLRDFAAKMADVQTERQKINQPQYETTQTMTEQGPQETLVRIDPRSGTAEQVTPTQPYTMKAKQQLRQALQGDPEQARQTLMEYADKHGGWPEEFMPQIQQVLQGSAGQSA